LKDDLNKLKFQTPALALQTIRKEIGYDKYLEEYATKTGNDLKVVSEPLDELEQAVTGHRTIQEFLAHVQEVNETIRKSRNQGDGVQLMTMHRAKGLEFEHVYCIGLVEDMLPHPKSLDGEGEKRDAAVEEERRLLYVGMTRAKRFLTLSAPLRYHGHRAEPSPFLYETGLLERPKRVAIASSPNARDALAGSLSRNSSGSRFVAKKDGVASDVPPNERMKAALAKYGQLPLAEGDTLHHKQLGPGTVDAIKPLSGDGGRRVMVKFPGEEKVYDLHLELSLYLGLMSESVKV
jgi:DNA helicase-2/ATP-dependent DNA helicase PcrA